MRKNGLKSICGKAKAMFQRNGLHKTYIDKQQTHDVSLNLEMERNIARRISQIYMEEIEDIERFVTNK